MKGHHLNCNILHTHLYFVFQQWLVRQSGSCVNRWVQLTRGVIFSVIVCVKLNTECNFSSI